MLDVELRRGIQPGTLAASIQARHHAQFREGVVQQPLCIAKWQGISPAAQSDRVVQPRSDSDRQSGQWMYMDRHIKPQVPTRH